MDDANKLRKLQLIGSIAYENSNIYKTKFKYFHDKTIL